MVKNADKVERVSVYASAKKSDDEENHSFAHHIHTLEDEE